MGKKIEKCMKNAVARAIARLVRVRKISPAELASVHIERLLVLRQHNQMGDMLTAVPAFRGIRRRFEGARITLLAAPVNSEVMRNNPYVDEVLVYAKREYRGRPLRLVHLIRRLRRRRFDLAIVLNTFSFSVTSMLLAAASGARIRIGSTSKPFGSDLTSRFYHMELPLPSAGERVGMHESRHNLYPLAAIGVSEDNLGSLIVPTAADEQDCVSFLATVAPAGAHFIVIHPGAGKKENIWPAESFAAVARALSLRFGLQVVMVRGPMDGEACDRFLETYPGTVAVISRPSVGFLGALMTRAALTLCNDTGIMHIAGAVGARCVAVFGPTDPARWKPVGDHVVAVSSADGKVSSVHVRDVIDRAGAILDPLVRNEFDM